MGSCPKFDFALSFSSVSDSSCDANSSSDSDSDSGSSSGSCSCSNVNSDSTWNSISESSSDSIVNKLARNKILIILIIKKKKKTKKYLIVINWQLKVSCEHLLKYFLIQKFLVSLMSDLESVKNKLIKLISNIKENNNLFFLKKSCYRFFFVIFIFKLNIKLFMLHVNYIN